MFKSAFIVLLFFSCSVLSWGQSANSVEKAIQLKETCTELTINGQENVTLTKNLNGCSNLQKIQFTNNGMLTIEDGLVLPYVTELDLTGTYVNTWELPKISTAFPNLKSISLSNCGLYFIGSSLTGFSQLESLDLSNNKLESLPDDLQFLSKLESLDISNNNLKANVGPLGYLWGLKQLDISGNKELPTQHLIRAISLNNNLNSLSLDFLNGFEESVPLLKESNISELSLVGPMINLPKNLYVIPGVQTLGFVGSLGISDSEKTISKMTQLRSLSFVDSEIPVALASTPQIKNIEVTSSNNLLKSNLEDLKSIQQLDTLDLQQTNVSATQLQTLQTAIPGTTILSNESNEKPLFQVKEVVPIVKAEVNIVTIESNKPNLVTVENVNFDIPENAFLDQNGKPIEGPVKLEITVYNDPIQIALAGAPMTFDNNGIQENFSSQGMLRFDAFDQNGNTLQPNPDNLIDVSMPNLQPNTDGNLYTFNEQTRKWEDANPQEWGDLYDGRSLQRMLDSINQTDYKALVKIEADEPLFQLKARYKPQQSYLQISRVISFAGLGGKSDLGTYKYYQEKNSLFHDQKLYLDTTISKEMILELLYKNKGYSPKKRGIKTERDYLNEPRKVWNVQIKNDGDNDRLRLTFNLEDTTYSLPVTMYPPYTSANPNLRSSRNANTDFEFERRMANIRDSIVGGKIAAEMEKIRDSLALQMKNAAINSSRLQIQNDGKASQMSRLGFSLGRFGLVNCDFFSRQPASGYAVLDSVVTDQNNVSYQSTPTVRVVYLDQFSYVEQPKEKLGLIQTSREIGIMILSSTLIGIIDFVSDASHRIGKIRTVDVSGKSPDEVNRLIYGD